MALFAAGGSGAQDLLVEGRRIFTQAADPACATCHALRDAGAQGTIGPSLDELQPDAERVAAAVRSGTEAMPSYKGRLTAEQIELLARYVELASRETP